MTSTDESAPGSSSAAAETKKSSFEDYLAEHGCVDLFERLMKGCTGNTGALGDPAGEVTTALQCMHRDRLGLGPRRTLDGFRAYAQRRFLVCADFHPRNGPTVLNLKFESFRSTLRALISVNARVLVYADFGPVQDTSFDAAMVNSLDHSFHVLGGEGGRSPHSPPPGTPAPPPAATMLGAESSTSTPSPGMGLTSPNSLGLLSASSQQSADPRSATITAFKEVLAKERQNTRFLKNISQELLRREFMDLVPGEVIVIPMGTSTTATAMSSATPPTPMAGTRERSGSTTSISSQDGVATHKSRRSSLIAASPATTAANSAATTAMIYTLCSFAELLVVDSLSVGKFNSPIFTALPGTIPETAVGFAAAEETKALTSLLCGAGERGKKRVLMLGDGPFEAFDLLNKEFILSGGSTGIRPNCVAGGKGGNFAALSALHSLSQEPGALENIPNLFDIVYLVGRSARRWVALTDQTGTVPLPKAEDAELVATKKLKAALDATAANVVNVMTPLDFIVAKGITKKRTTVARGEPLPTPKHMWLDIGPQTIAEMEQLAQSQWGSVLCIGGFGELRDGLTKLTQAIDAASSCTAVVAGESALTHLCVDDRASITSTGTHSSSTAARLRGPAMTRLGLSDKVARTLLNPASLAVLLAGRPLPGLASMPPPPIFGPIQQPPAPSR